MPIEKEYLPSNILRAKLLSVTNVIQTYPIKGDLTEYQLSHLKQLQERRDILAEAIVLLISKDL
jgi:hypothetical protein